MGGFGGAGLKIRLQFRIPDCQSQRSRRVNTPWWLMHLIVGHQKWLSATRNRPDRMEKCCCLWQRCCGGHRRPREPEAWLAPSSGDTLPGTCVTGASLAAGAEHVGSCHANTCLLRHLPSNVVDASQHPVISRLYDLHLANPCPVAEGWCAGTRCRVSRGPFLQAVGFLPGWFPTSSWHCFAFSELRQMQCYRGSAPGHLIACFEGLEPNKPDKHNITVISNKQNKW